MNSVAKPEDFQTRMFERIRAQMGDLMTDEELKKIFDAALQKAFFEPVITTINQGSYREEKKIGPSAFTSLVHDLLKEQVNALAKEWIAEHSTELTAMFKAEFDKGLLQMIVGVFQQSMNDKFMTFQSGMIDLVRSLPR